MNRRAKLIILSASMLIAGICYAQSAPTIQWARCYGGSEDEEAYSIQQTADGGYIVAGYTQSDDGDVSGWHEGSDEWGRHSDMWVVKLNSSGDIQWQKCLGGSGRDRAAEVRQTVDGGYIVVGLTYSNDGDVVGHIGSSNYWAVKLNSSGAIQWQKCLGGPNQDEANSFDLTTDGGLVIAGYSSSESGDVSGSHGGGDFWVVKLSSSQEIQWQKCLGGSAMDWPTSIKQTSDGGYIVAGWSYSSDGDVSGNNGEQDYWIVKLNATGDIVWEKNLGGTSWEIAHSIIQTTDDGYAVAGHARSNDGDVSGNNGNYDYWIVKLNTTGDFVWQKCLGGTSSDHAQSIQQTTDGGFIVAGYSYSNNGDVSGNNGSGEFWVVKLNSSGNLVWQKCLGGTSAEEAFSVQQTADGGFVVAGFALSNNGDVSGNNGGRDLWVVKLSPELVNITENEFPQQFELNAHPNPFNSAVSITAPAGAEIEIFDVNGRTVANISVGSRRASTASSNVIWQPSKSVNSGVYLVNAKVGDRKIAKRVVFLK